MACIGITFTFVDLNEYEPVVVFGGLKNPKQRTCKIRFSKLVPSR
jgi:hypothetical protein